MTRHVTRALASTALPAGLAASLAATLLAGCMGEVVEPLRPGGGASTRPLPAASLDEADLFGASSVRQLTRVELRDAVLDLYGVDATASIQELLPPDVHDEEATGNPFDNDYRLQSSSPTLVSGLELLADRIAERVLADDATRASALPCTPSGPADATCLRAMIQHLGPRAVRRPLEAAEVDEMVDALIPHAEEAGDFLVAAHLVIEVLVQHPEFLFRVELGAPTDDDPDLYRLGPHEIASRLAFLMWGSLPDQALIDAASAGELDTSAGVQRHALRLLADPRAERQIRSFHAQWLGYDEEAAPGSLQADMRAEADALVSRVTLEDAERWSELLTAEETYVTPRLAEHYGMPAIAAAAWVPSGAERGGGLLAQAAYLAVDATSVDGDTSPTFRGRNVFRRLLCGALPPPPPGLNVDAGAGNPGDCKRVRYSMVDEPSCAGCHRLMDPIGFGLEAFDAEGRFREVETAAPSCAVDARGELPGGPSFNGPRELGEIIASSGDFEACAVEQFFRFAAGRATGPADAPALEALERSLAEEGDFVGLVLAYVGSEAFMHRVVDPDL